jgi:hypothetical protein
VGKKMKRYTINVSTPIIIIEVTNSKSPEIEKQEKLS